MHSADAHNVSGVVWLLLDLPSKRLNFVCTVRVPIGVHAHFIACKLINQSWQLIIGENSHENISTKAFWMLGNFDKLFFFVRLLSFAVNIRIHLSDRANTCANTTFSQILKSQLITKVKKKSANRIWCILLKESNQKRGENHIFDLWKYASNHFY